jgi:hypothetical protein
MGPAEWAKAYAPGNQADLFFFAPRNLLTKNILATIKKILGTKAYTDNAYSEMNERTRCQSGATSNSWGL